MQFLITAYDGTDEGALDRRMAVRPQHLANMQKVKETGSVVCAGGILSDEGKPIGSCLVMDFASRQLLDDYLASEPYIAAEVWKDVKVEPFNVVIINDQMVGK